MVLILPPLFFLILRLCDQSCTKVKDYQEGSGGVKDGVSRGRLVTQLM